MEFGKYSVLGSVRALLLLAALGCLPAHAGAILQIGDTGNVTGASGVDVGGVSFDVEFVDGTCDAVFGRCSDSSFTFITESNALEASQALIDQVFTDDVFNDVAVAQGTVPEIEGCGNLGVCGIYTPFRRLSGSLDVDVAFAATQGQPGFVDFTGSGRLRVAHFTDLNATYARWTPSSEVPAPASLPLLIAGMAAFAWIPRRKKHSLDVYAE